MNKNQMLKRSMMLKVIDDQSPKRIYGYYFRDGSGEIEVTRKGCRDIYSEDNGTIKGHIKDIEKQISQNLEDNKILKRASKLLKKTAIKLNKLKEYHEE